MYRHKKCRYVCGFVPLLDLNTAKQGIYFGITKLCSVFFSIKLMTPCIMASLILNLII